MKFGKLMRNRLAPAIFFSVLLLAAAGAAYLAIGAGANVNCIAGTCYSTTGQTAGSSPYAAGVFTGDNDTASIECHPAGAKFSGGGGNDTFYLHDPQTATSEAVTIEGEDGDDVILDSCTPTTGSNTLNGVDGNDFIADGEGDTTLTGDAGNDLLSGGVGDDKLGTSNGDPGNDVFIGGPGKDTYNTNTDDGDDIVIIHRGDVLAPQTESYTCYGSDTILMFGFDRDGVIEVPPAITITYPDTGDTYGFTATSPNKCTIIFVD